MEALEQISAQFMSSLKAYQGQTIVIEDIAARVQTAFDTSSGTENERKQILEQVFRDRMHQNISEFYGQLAEQELDTLLLLVDISVHISRANLISSSTPFTLLSDIFDCLTIESVEYVFTYVEDNVHVWMDSAFYSAAKIQLLRTCNDLLRRLSRSQNTIFCGRIQLFLARLFPISEKSALNLVSQFNFANITTYSKDELDLLISEEKEMSKDACSSTSASNTEFDVKLYTSLWDLQDSFRNPNQNVNQDKWSKMQIHIKTVLSAFESVRLDDEIARGFRSSDSCTQMDTTEDSIEIEEPKYFTKFLTNPKLLELQLRDSLFRRHILVQMLILFQYFEYPSKFKTESLKKEQLNWVKETKIKVYKLIKETPPNGEQFCLYCQKLLKREEIWMEWKNDSCPAFPSTPPSEDKSMSARKELRRKRKLGDKYRQNLKDKKTEIGSDELSRLWNLNLDNIEACQGERRNFTPDLKDFFAEAIEQLDPENMIEPEYKLINNNNWSWRALRLLSRRSPYFFQGTNAVTKPIGEYLEGVIKQVSKDFDGQDIGAAKLTVHTTGEMDLNDTKN